MRGLISHILLSALRPLPVGLWPLGKGPPSLPLASCKMWSQVRRIEVLYGLGGMHAPLNRRQRLLQIGDQIPHIL